MLHRRHYSVENSHIDQRTRSITGFAPSAIAEALSRILRKNHAFYVDAVPIGLK
jgi:hypothetical protein